MNCKRTLTIAGFAAAAAAAAAAPLPALSQSYIGGAIGTSNAKDFCELRTACDQTGSSWRIFAGLWVTPNFGVEAGYTDLGKAKGNPPTGGTLTHEAAASELLAVLAYPANPFTVFGKVGGYYGKTKSVFETGTATIHGRETAGGLTYGLGAQYDFTRSLGVRGDWQRYGKVGGSETGGGTDIDVFLIGLTYTFR